ncbi:MAG TPA: sodium:solute symporter, partial [Flavobacteriaceae bacterium]|nr:sodium:solute symporter [Flavobacteriaceae bacterium]
QNEKMNILDFSFDFENRYTFWSGIIGGSFLALSYFGTDQSQVQRYLSGKSVKQSQMGLIMNGLLKVPMQFFILLVGVMVFVFYQFNSSPLHFNPSAVNAVKNSEYAAQYEELEKQKESLDESLIDLQILRGKTENPEQEAEYAQEINALNQSIKELRAESVSLIKQANPNAETNDKDYVFIHFILNNLHKGFIGLLLAVILSAAMSSTSSELNALGSTTAIDLYKRNRPGKREKHYVAASRAFTLLWGIIAIIVACSAHLFDNLIQLVNIIGSIFYGNVLGIFLLAFFVKFVSGKATFIAAIITQIIIIYIWWIDLMPYLWLNLVGCAIVMFLAMVLQVLLPKPKIEKVVE